jgi:hypothetical protein
MPGFGPFYPPTLQEAVNHAERLATLLQRVPVNGAYNDSTAWITGRAEEIACFVDAVTRDWHAGRLSNDGAARTIDRYIDTLHRDLDERPGVDAPRCCSAALAVTSEPLTCFSRTVSAPLLPFRPSQAQESSQPGVTTVLRGLDRRCLENDSTS